MATPEPKPALTLEGYPLLQPGDPKPPPGSPNVVAIVLDDTGFAHLGRFGSDIATPNIDRLADGGLRYNRFHVTSLCSPTRAAFLTGRNHHAVGMGFLADIPLAYPGYTARIAKSAGTLARILRDAGYSTLAVGKWHLTPRFQRSAAGPFGLWPLGLGFERYYGFLQGDTNHWTPNLVRDNQYVDPPAGPADGYHLTEDLSATARRYVLDQQHAAPGKPFFLYFALGAMHAPHHVAPEWVAPYRGRFDQGWDAWRREIFDRQQSLGVVPEGTILTERPSWVAAWDDVPADQRRMHTRQQEVFAGFLTHTDAQIGALVDLLAEIGQLDNTIVLLFSDNGASAEGGQYGSVNEHRFSAPIARVVRRQPGGPRRLGRSQHLQPLLVGLGLGRQHAPPPLEAIHLAGRDAHAADRALAGRHPSPRRGPFPVRPRHRPRADDSRRHRPRVARVGRRGPPAAGRRCQPAGHLRRRVGGRRAPDPVLRDARVTLDLPRGLEGHDRPHLDGRARRGGAGDRQPRLRPGPMGALRLERRLLRVNRPLR